MLVGGYIKGQLGGGGVGYVPIPEEMATLTCDDVSKTMFSDF